MGAFYTEEHELPGIVTAVPQLRLVKVMFSRTMHAWPTAWLLIPVESLIFLSTLRFGRDLIGSGPRIATRNMNLITPCTEALSQRVGSAVSKEFLIDWG